MALDEAKLGDGSDDYDLGRVEGTALDESHMTTDSTALLGGNNPTMRREGLGPSTRRPKWMSQSRRVPEPDEGDDEVPLSLLTEGVDVMPDDAGPSGTVPNISPGPQIPPRHTRTRSGSAQPRRRGERRLHEGPASGRDGYRAKLGLVMIDPKERALWRWANVENLDNFLKDVYDYYLGNGIWCIMLSRVLNLLYVASRLPD